MKKISFLNVVGVTVIFFILDIFLVIANEDFLDKSNYIIDINEEAEFIVYADFGQMTDCCLTGLDIDAKIYYNNSILTVYNMTKLELFHPWSFQQVNDPNKGVIKLLVDSFINPLCSVNDACIGWGKPVCNPTIGCFKIFFIGKSVGINNIILDAVIVNIMGPVGPYNNVSLGKIIVGDVDNDNFIKDDNCPEIHNPDQTDSDNNGIGDICEPFIRGDANSDRNLNIADAIYILNYLFQSKEEPGCMDAADANDDGLIDIADPLYLLNYLFSKGPEPYEPFAESGADLTEDLLNCGSYGK